MLIIPPKELDGKIGFIHKDVIVKEGVKLTEHEKVLFEKYRERIRKGFNNQQ